MKDKIIFWLGNDYTHYCLSYALKKNYDCDLYAIAEITERPKHFFQKQKLVDFEKIWFLHDHIKKKITKPDLDYLAEFEKKYKIDLWKLAQNERIFNYYNYFHKFSSDEILNIVEQECRFYEYVLENVKPDFFFSKISSLHHQELIYQMYRNAGVNVFILRYSNIGQTCIVTRENDKLDAIEDLEKIDIKNKNFKELQNYLRSFDLSKQLKSKIITPGTGASESIHAVREFLLHSDSKNIKTHYTYYGRTKFKVLCYYMLDYLQTKIRKSYIDRNLKMEIEFSEPFVYFPLHTEVERALLISAPFYINQIEIIKSIAKSLPINFKLYVKEHPAQVKRSWRSKSEYRQVMNIPNVVMIHPEFSNEELYRNCSLLITIAGTAGFEASFYGKPVITFVPQNYSLLPSVSTLKNFDDLPQAIRESLNKKIEPKYLEAYITLFEKNVCKFDWADFMAKLGDEFFYGHNLMDVEINEDKMKIFLDHNNSSLQILAEEHIKKIKAVKKQKYG